MKCKTCGIETLKLHDDGNCQTCHQKTYQRAYHKTPKYRAYRRAYRRAYMRAYHKTDKYKAYMRAYYQRPEVKAQRKAYMKAYNKTPKYKAYKKAYMRAYYLNVTKPKLKKE